MEKATHGKMNSRVRGIFLSLEGNQTIRWGMGKEKKRKKRKENEERKGKEEKKKEEEENHACRRKKKKRVQFLVFRLSKIVSPRIKVGLLDESY